MILLYAQTDRRVDALMIISYYFTLWIESRFLGGVAPPDTFPLDLAVATPSA